MPRQASISPNDPDVAPDYVDAAGLNEQAKEQAAKPPADDIVDCGQNLQCLHSLNAELETVEADDDETPELGGEPSPLAEAAPSAAAPSSREEDFGSDDVPENKSDGNSSFREGECIPNTPDIPPDFVPVSEVAEKPDVDEAPTVETAAVGLSVPHWLRWSYFAATLVVVALFGVFVFSQTISALALAASLPVWAQYALLIPLGICALTLLGVCASLVWSWLRLRTVRQINLAALNELRRRAESRQDGISRFREARTHLESYMNEYPLTGKRASSLIDAGCPDRVLERLAQERTHLMDLATDSRDWLNEFRNRFQNRIDSAAKSRVRSWSIKAAGCVMASPLPLLDAMLILGISFKMIRDLSTLYNVRSGWSSTLVLFNRSLFYAFIAGVADEATESLGEVIGEEVSTMFGSTVLSSVGAGLARAVAPKLGEGAINGLFVHRLGSAAIRVLQPLRPK